MGNALLYRSYWVDFGYRVSHSNGWVKFEYNDKYMKTNLNGNDLSAYDIYFPLGGEEGGLCFNNSNTSTFVKRLLKFDSYFTR